MASIPLRSSSAVVRPRECACLTFSANAFLDGLLVLVQERALVPPELEVVVPPLDRHELACDEDRYRILRKIGSLAAGVRCRVVGWWSGTGHGL
jgi:hypothetical protein